jgi:carboxypeptidase D
MHAPPVNWTVCSHIRVFPDSGTGPQFKGDSSPDPIQGVLPQIIEATNRVLVANGDWGELATLIQF